MNKIFLTGNCGKDPEVKHLDGGKIVAKFPFATSETYKNKAGEKITNTEWHNIVAWGKLAEIIESWVKSGSKLALIGKVTTRNYEDKDGNKKYFTEVVLSEMEMLGSRTTEESKAVEENRTPTNTGLPNDEEFQGDPASLFDAPPPTDDDLPY